MIVLHLISGRGPTGPAASALSDVKSLLAAGHKAYVCSRDIPGITDACQAESLPFVGGLKLGKGAMRYLHMPRDTQRLRAIIRELAVDVIHVHRGDDQVLASAALGRSLSTTLIRTWHRSPHTTPKLILNRLARHVDGCVCVSREHIAMLKKAGAKACEFIHVGVDTSVFNPLAPDPPRQSSEIRIGQVGRWKRGADGKDRGQLAALDIFAALKPVPGWKGVLIGRGEMGAELRKAAYTDRKLSEQRVAVVDFPKQTAAGFAAELASLNLGLVFVPGSDGTSRAAVEMLACGVPLMVADLPGLREFSEDSASAIRQLPDDPHGWASAIRKLIADPVLLQEMRVAARRRAERFHSLNARGTALAEFYKLCREI